MKKTDIGTIEGQNSVAKANPLQTGYIIYAGLYGIVCGKSTHRFGIIINNRVLLLLFAGVLLLTIIVFIYNHKYETRKANKQVCYVFCLWALCRFLVYFMPYLV